MFKEMELDGIKASKENYRSTIPEGPLEELTASVKAKGVLQPILVRPINGNHEIVAGHRRYLAAQAAGLETIPVMIRELNDLEALEIQVIENSQREDPNPMDEARGFQHLVERGSHTPESLAEKLGRNVAYIYSRVKLLKIIPAAQEKVASGELSMGLALLLTRLRHEKEQAEFLEEMLNEEMSVPQAKDELANRTGMDLENAEFDTAACKECSYNSFNQSTLWPELTKSSECMDEACFLAKTLEHYTVLLKEREAAGFAVLADKKTIEKLLSWQNKKSCRIVAPGIEARYGIEKPKKYKSKCMNCTEHHVWFMYESESYRGKEIEFGEICMKASCIEEMKGKKAKPGQDTEPAQTDHNKDQKARMCCDRFLKGNVPEKAVASEELRKRLYLYYLINGSHWFEQQVMEEIFKVEDAHGWNALEKTIFELPADTLIPYIKKVLAAKLAEDTDTGLLLRLAAPAGIGVAAEFEVDEEWLKGNTKDALYDTAKELGVQLSKTNGEALVSAADLSKVKKGEMVKAFLDADLVGKAPEHFKSLLEVDKD